MDHLRGQGYDRASNVTHKISDWHLSKSERATSFSMYTHCSSHVLDVVISSALEFRVIGNALSTIGEVCTFLSCSVHRVQALQGNAEKEILNANHQRLKLLCPT